ncbi:MAG: hypothetical protein DSY33_05040 [Archaeoglobus sp.]|nr:MAG: hypothetical protein DSY33_05040 [Archaeoglobus sp.]
MDDLVCKFVYVGGDMFGESIDVHKNMLIVKVKSKFYAVPMKLVKKVEGDKIYIENFDIKRAETEGERWVKEKSKPVSIEELGKYGFGDDM